jgi:hypothetical protein
MAEEKCTVQLLGQYNLYVRETKHLSFYEYWSSKSVAWPDLAKVALYWTELQTSSIAAERAFASLRQTDMPSRVGRSHMRWWRGSCGSAPTARSWRAS